MLQKRFNFITMFLTGAFFIVLGWSLILHHMEPWDWVYMMFVFGMYGTAILRFLDLLINFSKLSHRFMKFMDIVFWLIIGLISSSGPHIFRAVMPRIVGCWIALHAVVKAIVLYIKIKDDLPGRLRLILLFFFDFIMACILLFQPNKQMYLISYGVGIYLMIYGVNILWNFFREILPQNSGTRLDQKLRLAVPPFLAAVIPPTLMHTILDKDDEETAREEFNAYKSHLHTDLEVMIHLAPSGPAMLGHMDIIYKDTVISYGCYDPHTRRLAGAMGDGVILTAPRNPYIRNCLENENKVLVGFGISLQDEQRIRMERKMSELWEEFVDFFSDEQLYQKGMLDQKNRDDYISRVTRHVPGAHFYKTTNEKLKTFFVLSSNCVYFAHQILKEIGLNLFDLSGIISPGSYFDFLNKQFKSDKSFVIRRKVYRKRDAGAM